MGSTYFQDKTIWITGASSGIGEGFARKLSSMGATVVLSARREQELLEVQNSLAYPDKSEVVVMDMENSDEIDEVSNYIMAKYNLDIAILNAGISQRASVLETTFETEARIMNINFHGQVRIAKQLLPYFLNRGEGHFVIMSSVTGKIGVPNRSSYSASKHALHGYFDSLRAEVSDAGIAVTILCPGYIFTNISRNAVLGDGQSQQKLDENSKNGMSVNTFVKRAIKGIAQKKQEMLIGGKEKIAVYVKRLFPGLISRIVKKANV